MDTNTAWKTHFSQILEKLTEPPQGPPFNGPFLLNGISRDDLHSLQRLIIQVAGQEGTDDDLLLVATLDKALMAAAVLAALGGGPRLVIPYALSSPVLESLRDDYGIKRVLSEHPDRLPAGMTALPLDSRPGKGSLTFAGRGPDMPFVTIFTGGSTGQPQLWEKTPRNLIGEASFLAKKFNILRDDIILTTVGPQHIYGLLFTLLIPLVSGAKVINEMPQFHGEIEEKMEEYSPTVLVGAPAHYRAMRGKRFTGRSLRLAVSSGGFLTKEDSLWFSEQTGVGVTEVYGSTETGGIATRCQARGEEAWIPFDCLSWRLKGEQLGVRSPFMSSSLACDGAGFFIMGDRVEADREADGDRRFILLGRMDGIVKVAGKRVALNEVEARIKELDQVADAYVFSLASPTMRESEIVCLIQGEKTMSYPLFREKMQAFLEPYAIPRRVIWLEKIPLTPAGKPDRQAAERLF